MNFKGGSGTENKPVVGSSLQTLLTGFGTHTVPYKIAVVSPLGATLATATSSNGIASLDVPVTAGGALRLQVIDLGSAR